MNANRLRLRELFLCVKFHEFEVQVWHLIPRFEILALAFIYIYISTVPPADVGLLPDKPTRR